MEGVVVTPTSPHLGVGDEGGAAPSLPLFVTSLSLALSLLPISFILLEDGRVPPLVVAPPT